MKGDGTLVVMPSLIEGQLPDNIDLLSMLICDALKNCINLVFSSVDGHNELLVPCLSLCCL